MPYFKQFVPRSQKLINSRVRVRNFALPAGERERETERDRDRERMCSDQCLAASRSDNAIESTPNSAFGGAPIADQALRERMCSEREGVRVYVRENRPFWVF